MEKNLESLQQAYRRAYDAMPQEALELDLRLTVKTMQALAEGRPIPLDQLAEVWGMPVEQVRTVLAQAVSAGRAEIDEHENLVGAVLTLNPTEHQLSIDGQQLYAWCAFDALFAPGVTGKVTRISSSDPVSGAPISAIVTPEGVEQVQPQGAVITVVGTDSDLRGGPRSPRCLQMLFFASRDSAQQWLDGHNDVAILTLNEAFDLAREFQIEPARRLELVPDGRTI